MMMMSISKLLTRSRMGVCVYVCGGNGGLACKVPQDPPRSPCVIVE